MGGTLIYHNPFKQTISQAQQQDNAKFICYSMMAEYGVSIQAVCGMLGNFESESGLNPNRPESNYAYLWPNWGRYGFGLAQWTPWYTRQDANGNWINPDNYHGSGLPTYGRWATLRGFTVDANNGGTIGNMEPQIAYICAGMGGWQKSSYYSMLWNEFRTATLDSAEMARIFYRNYERSQAAAYGNRPANATRWFNFLYPIFGGGVAPPPPTPEPDRASGMSFLLKYYATGGFDNGKQNR